jgi:hypothetical protein
MSYSIKQSKSFTGTNRYLPGLTMPTGHHPSDLHNPDDKEVENAYVEVRSCHPSTWPAATALPIRKPPAALLDSGTCMRLGSSLWQSVQAGLDS